MRVSYPFALKLYSRLMSTTRRIKRTKITLLGDSGVGKSSIVNQYKYGHLPENLEATVGATCFNADVRVDDQDVKVSIWDTAGQEMFRSLVPNFVLGSSIVLLVFDVSSLDSVKHLSDWLDFVYDRCDPESLICCVVANKMDLDDKSSLEVGQAWATEHGMMFMDVSAFNGPQVDALFSAIVERWYHECKVKEKEGEANAVLVKTKTTEESSCNC